MSTLTYEQMASAILNYYSSGSTIWSKVNLGTASSAEILQAFSNIPQLQAVTSTSGVVLGYDYAEPLRQVVTYSDDIASAFNSNVGAGSYSDGIVDALIPANFGGGGGSAYTVGSGAAASGGLIANVLSTPVSPLAAVGGVSLACKLGAKIDGALYNLNPDWWDEHYPTLNPETWADIAGENELGQSIIRTLFGVDSAGNSTAYMSSDMLAYTYMMLREAGAFSSGYSTAEYTGSTASFTNPNITTASLSSKTIYFTNRFGQLEEWLFSSDCEVYAYFNTAENRYVAYALSSSRSASYVYNVYNSSGTLITTRTYSLASYGVRTYNNNQAYINYISLGTTTSAPQGIIGTVYNNPYTTDTRQITTIILDGTIHTSSPVDGITKDGTGTTPDPTLITGTTVDDVITQLKQNYPDLFDGSITSSVLQPDGSIKDFEYVPVPWMDNTTQTTAQPTTGTKTQTQTTIDPDTFTELVPSTPTGTSTNPPDTGEGDGSPDGSPTGSASSLWAIYNPTQAQLDSFGSWLWSSNFVEQLKKLFNDPMQAIIGVHKVYATPPTSGSANIICGYLDSGVSAAKVSAQYTSIDCGTVNLYEYFGNVFDYDPYTKVSVYLPFIGVVPLKTSEVMRASINIIYGVDVITGACLAKIKVIRDGAGAILYSYGGSCACHYPISSGSYSGIISGVLTAATGIAASVATGNPLAAAAGVVSGASHMRATVQHSGGFTGCSGAMGPKIPYIIIERPQTKMANGYEAFEGIPQNEVVSIGSCSGYARFSEVHVMSSRAYDSELSEIETLLKNGVLI